MTQAGATEVRLKRAYEPPADSDGVRVLVDRLWPRGLRKSDAAIDHWMKDVGPSTDLRRWFGHEPSRWNEFRRRYRVELSHKPEVVNELKALVHKGPITLIFAARDELHNEAVVLRDVLTH
jgi:uncharacterized protein YeaO (DUF488 family)